MVIHVGNNVLELSNTVSEELLSMVLGLCQMLNNASGFQSIYIACGYSDLRKGIDGFASIIQQEFKLYLFQTGILFLFCGRRTDRIKGLLWEGDGFLLLYKRLETGKFQWPRNEA